MTRIQIMLIIAGAIVHFHVDELVIIFVAAAVVHVAFGAGATALLVLLLHAFVFGATILEPDLNLCLRQIE